MEVLKYPGSEAKQAVGIKPGEHNTLEPKIEKRRESWVTKNPMSHAENSEL